jgi:hypothetical protein
MDARRQHFGVRQECLPRRYDGRDSDGSEINNS